MRPRIGTGLGLLLLWAQIAVSPVLCAQTLTLDSVMPIPLTSSVAVSAFSIDHSTGNVIVRSAAGNYAQCAVVAGQPPTINSFAPNTSQVVVSSSLTLFWVSSNTIACSPTLGLGTVWSSLGTLPSSGSQNLVAPATAGTVVFQLNCTNGTQTASATTSVLVIPSAPLPTANLSVPPGSVASCDPSLSQANKTQVSWTSTGAAYCRATEQAPIKTNWSQLPCLGGGCPDPLDPRKLRPNQTNQDVFVAPGNVAQAVSLTLTCFAANGQASLPSTGTLNIRTPLNGDCPPPSYTPSSVTSTPIALPDGSFQFQANVANPQGALLTASVAQQGQFGDATVEIAGNTAVVRYYPRGGALAPEVTVVNDSIRVIVGDAGGGVVVTYAFQLDLALYSNGFEGG